jgi:hypothetical protein
MCIVAVESIGIDRIEIDYDDKTCSIHWSVMEWEKKLNEYGEINGRMLDWSLHQWVVAHWALDSRPHRGRPTR